MNENSKINKRILKIEREVMEALSFGTLEAEKISKLKKEKEELQEKCSHSLIDISNDKKICAICHKIIE